MGIAISRRKVFAPYTVLIVEDDEDIAATLEALLREEFDANIVLAQTGQEASQIVSTLPLDLILLDYHLPDINGIQLYDFWQDHYDLRSLPIIMTSADPPYKELEKRHLLNVTKPFDLENVLEAVEHALMPRQRTVQRRVY